MRLRRPPSFVPRRSGFTLFELLIALAVILLIAGIVWPAYLRFFGDSELKESAQQVRDTIAATRLGAIDHGVPYQFFYEPQGPHYLMLPGVISGEGASLEDSPTEVTYRARSGTLPEGFMFQTVESVDAGTVTVPEDLLAELPDRRDLEGVSWAAPAVFYPDGTGTDYTFELEDDREQYISISIRSLTGGTSVSDVMGRKR